MPGPGRDRRQHRDHPGRPGGAARGGDRPRGAARPRGPAARPSRRRPRDRRRRGPPEGRRRRRPLRRADRGPAARPQDRPEGAAQALVRLPLHRPVRPAPGRAGEGDGAPPLRPGPQASGPAPRTRDPAAGPRGDADRGRRGVDRRAPRRAGRPDRQLRRRRRRARVGRRAGRARPQDPVVGGDGAARSRDARRRGARDARGARSGRRQAGRSLPARGDRRRRADARRDLLVADPDPRLPRPVLRRGRRPARPRHDLDPVPGDSPFPGGVRPDPRPPAGEGPADLPGRGGLLRPERRRGRGVRRGAPLAGGGPPGARPVDARGRARLGPEGAAPAARPSRGRGRGRRRPRVGDASLAPGRHAGPAEHPAARPDRGGDHPAARALLRADPAEHRPAVPRGRGPRGRSLDRGLAVPHVPDPHAGQDREHVRRRVVRGRGVRPREDRPGRLPAPPPGQCPGAGGHPARGGADGLAAPALAAPAGSRRGRPHRARDRLRPLQARRDPRRGRHGGRRRAGERRDPRHARRLCPGLRPHDQPRQRGEPARGEHPADHLAHAPRGDRLRPGTHHQSRLGRLPDPPLRRGAPDRARDDPAPREPPLGVGEAASSPVPAALGNAVFDATGVRLRVVPFRPDRVKAALASARS